MTQSLSAFYHSDGSRDVTYTTVLFIYIFVFLALQPIVVVFPQPGSGLYLLTPWSRVLLEKLTGSAPSQIPRIFGTRRFTPVLTSARHLSLSWANSIQSSQTPPTSCRSILILSSHLGLGLPSGIFPSGVLTRTLWTPLPCPIRATCTAHLILLDFTTRTKFGKEYTSLSSSLCIFIFPCYLVPLRPKYSPQHPILKHPQPTFLPQHQRPSFTPIQNNGQYYNSIYLDL